MSINLGLIRLILVVTLELIGAVAQAAEEKNSDKQEHNVPKELLWEATWQGTKTLASSLEDLYVALYNMGILPVRLYTEDSNRPVSEVMRDVNLIRGKNFPLGIDSVLCDINAHVCTRKKTRVSTKSLNDITRHIGGFLPSVGNWINNGTQKLFIPDIDLTWTIRFQPMKKPLGTSVEDMISEYLVDCNKVYKLGCEQIISKLNASAPSTLKTDVEASPILPVPSVITSFPANIDPRRPWKPKSDIKATGWRKEAAWSKEWLNTWRRYGTTKLLFKTFKTNLYSQGLPIVNAHPSDPHYGDQEILLKAISHPFRNAVDFPPPLQAQIEVGILDYWLDENHCDLPPACTEQSSSTDQCIDIREQAPQRLRLESAPNCASVNSALETNRDHGTHVTGLIAAKLNQNGIAGLDPYAKISFFEVNPNTIRAAAEKPRIELAPLMKELLAHLVSTQVINVSWFYPAVSTKDIFVETLIKNAFSGKLIVAAAGNDAIHFDLNSACKIEPACAGADNIISVAGLSADIDTPKIWTVNEKEGSNYGDRFDIAAVAQNVFSLSSANHTGIFSGTSQAAPQVTAAAALIYSLQKSNYQDIGDFRPIWVKNRLMYTADLFPELIGKVWSGRLNVDQALKVDTSSVIYFDADNPDIIHPPVTGALRFFQKGYTSKNCNDPTCESDTIECGIIGKANERIRVKGLRRMWKNNNTGRYVIFYNKSEERQDIQLKRITDCKLISPSQIVEITSDTGATTTINLGQVSDYVSSMF